MKTIPLTQGKVALVDDCDYAFLSRFKWFAMRNRRHWCAARNRAKLNGKRGTVYMHREILCCPGFEVDHKDGNGLNNQRSNLRRATDLQQAVHRWNPINRSGYRGVKRKGNRFEARINDHRRYQSLGHFATAIEAARVYDKAAKRIHGEFAVLNWPEGTL